MKESESDNELKLILCEIKNILESSNIIATDVTLEGSFNKYYSNEDENSCSILEKISVNVSNNHKYKNSDSETVHKLNELFKNFDYKKINLELNMIFNTIQKISIGQDYINLRGKRADSNVSFLQDIIDHEKVSIIIKWDHCSSSSNNCVKLYDLIEKNYEFWKDKITIFMISSSRLLNPEDEVKYYRYPEIVKQFLIDYSEERFAKQLYNVNSFSFMLIIDQQSKLIYNGDHLYMGTEDLEKLIFNSYKDPTNMKQSIIEDEKPKPLLEKPDKPTMSFKTFSRLLNEITQTHEKILSTKLDNSYWINLLLQKKYNFILDVKNSEVLVLDTGRECNFELDCYKEDYQTYQNLLEDIFSHEEIQIYELKINLINTLSLDLPFKQVCLSCRKVLKTKLKYYCYICKKFYCYRCINNAKDKPGFQALLHKEHYLIVLKEINNFNINHIEVEKLPKNNFSLQEESKLSRTHKYLCSFCPDHMSAIEHNERFICLTCNKGGKKLNESHTNCCFKCFEKFYVKKKVKSLVDNQHKIDHVYLHMIYNGEEYYQQN